MRWRVLGPVEVTADGRTLPINRPQQRGVLAYLLLHACATVSAGELIDAMWAETPPATARTQIHGYVSHIRQALRAIGSESRLTSRSGTYRINVEHDELDVAVFTGQLAAARTLNAAGATAVAVDKFRAALALWQGTALTGAAGAYVTAAVAGLEEQLVTTHEELAAIELASGSATPVVARLGPLLAKHPLRERLAAQLMCALANSGRQADALRLYEQTRQRLADELGVDPGTDLVDAHLRILRQADRSSTSPAADVRTPPAPAQLPPSIAAFAGRERALADLDRLSEGLTGSWPAAPAIVAVVGSAGVGKTALVVHWAHRVRDRFPAGQLYVDLRGFDAAEQVMTPTAVVCGFLQALGVSPERIPADVDAQTGLYRTLVDGKRLLVVLDNARDADQVRPLLPGTSTAVVVVTSRDQLTGLVAVEGAHPLHLDLMPATEARALLARRLGTRRSAAEPAAVDTIIAACAGLPLALGIAAARIQQTRFPLAAIAAELTHLEGRLDALDTGDLTSQIRAVFSWSYEAVSPSSARLFRLVGLHPGPELSITAAMSLAGQPRPVVRRLLVELCHANLLTETSPNRYTCHDLLRAYAAELAHRIDHDNERRSATTRILDHYLHTAYAGDQILDPWRDPIALSLGPPAPDTQPECLTDQQRVTGWFDTERLALIAALRHAAESGFDAHAWQLAWSLDTLLFRRGHWHDRAAAWRAATHAARRLGNPIAEAYACRFVADADIYFGDYDDAERQLTQAYNLYLRSNHQLGLGRTERQRGILRWRQGRTDEALQHIRQALALFDAAGYQYGVAAAINAIGQYHGQLGDHTTALSECARALALFQQLDHMIGQAISWDGLGYAHQHLGHHTEAARCYEQALALFRKLGDRYHEATMLNHLGDTHHATGDISAAHHAWKPALDILTSLDHPDADNLRGKLRRP
jgi:DNA-binding SARP family transcriptional activator/tetratricopeptide (TPR) repeat protein